MKREWKYSNNTVTEKKLKKLSLKLEKLCRKEGLTYAEVYLIQSENTCTINVRAKKEDNTVSNSYAFIPKVK